MPFIRTNVHKHTSVEQRQAIVESIHLALIEAIGMPQDELFNMVTEYGENQFWCSQTFNGYARSDRVVVIEITMRRGRSDAMKRALYASIAAHLKDKVQIPSKDVYIFIHENDYSDWSAGGGLFAMSLVQQTNPAQ